jgi:hypothetical protein
MISLQVRQSYVTVSAIHHGKGATIALFLELSCRHSQIDEESRLISVGTIRKASLASS